MAKGTDISDDDSLNKNENSKDDDNIPEPNDSNSNNVISEAADFVEESEVKSESLDELDDPYFNLSEDPEDGDYNKDLFAIDSDMEIFQQVAGVYQIWGNWAYFELQIITPEIAANPVVSVIQPKYIQGSDELEFVYPIFDFGNKLSTSKASDMYSVGSSMCKLFYTIEKMIAILLERLQESGVTDAEMESQIAFDGHQVAQRKAFESIINLSYNVVVTNFDPGEWGESYLNTIKLLADKGYGYPSETPRDTYKKLTKQSPSIKR